MKLKTFIIIGILAIVALPSINSQFQSLELNTKDDTNRANAGYKYEWIIIAFGRIANLEEFGRGYCLYYSFNAIDLICLMSTGNHPIPFIHRFNDGEWLCMTYPVGIITDHFIFAFDGG
jgi:hypothetical protein